jgi:predicted nucleic acid-binding protein
MSDRIFLDTNVLVYAYDSSDPLKQKRAQEILRSGMLSGSACVSAQVLGELFVVLTRKIPHPLTTAHAIGVVRALGKLDVVETGFLAVNLAVHIVMKTGIAYWDALIIAVARSAGCSFVFTEGLTNGQAFDGVTVVNPFVPAGPQ